MPYGSPEIDAGVLVTATAALAAAGTCVRALGATRRGARLARCFPRDRRRADRTDAYRAAVVLWTVLAGILVATAIGGPFDVLDRLTEFGRGLAHGQGWYRDRRPMQAALTGTILIVGAAVLWYLLDRARGPLPRHRPALVGSVLLAALLLVNALSLHAVDAMLGASWGTVSTGEWLTVLAVLPVFVCASRHARMT